MFSDFFFFCVRPAMRCCCIPVSLAFVVCIGCSQQSAEPTSSIAPAAADSSMVSSDNSPTIPASPPPSNTDQPVAGTISGQPFRPDLITFANAELKLTAGKDIFPDAEISLQLPDADGELTGREWSLGGDVFGSPMISVSSRQGQDLPDTHFVGPDEYSLRIKILRQTPGEIEGTIDLVLKTPANSQLSGRFTAAVSKSASAPLGPEDAPYVQGRIDLPLSDEPTAISAVMLGKGADGRNLSNGAGGNYVSGESGWVSSETFKPQITSVIADEQNGIQYRHVKLQPGEYLIGVEREDILVVWKLVTVNAQDQQTIDLSLDPATCGSLVVTLPETADANPDDVRFRLIPAALIELNLGKSWLSRPLSFEEGQKTLTFTLLPAGRYVLKSDDRTTEVEIQAGQQSSMTLP